MMRRLSRLQLPLTTFHRTKFLLLLFAYRINWQELHNAGLIGYTESNCFIISKFLIWFVIWLMAQLPSFDIDITNQPCMIGWGIHWQNNGFMKTNSLSSWWSMYSLVHEMANIFMHMREKFHFYIPKAIYVDYINRNPKCKNETPGWPICTDQNRVFPYFTLVSFVFSRV